MRIFLLGFLIVFERRSEGWQCCETRGLIEVREIIQTNSSNNIIGIRDYVNIGVSDQMQSLLKIQIKQKKSEIVKYTD